MDYKSVLIVWRYLPRRDEIFVFYSTENKPARYFSRPCRFLMLQKINTNPIPLESTSPFLLKPLK
jgi:hypothetical protein